MKTFHILLFSFVAIKCSSGQEAIDIIFGTFTTGDTPIVVAQVTDSDIISNRPTLPTISSASTAANPLLASTTSLSLSSFFTTPTSSNTLSSKIDISQTTTPSITPPLTTPTSSNTLSSKIDISQTSTPSITSLRTSASAFASTLPISAKVGIGIGVFLVFIIMILPSILLWRSKRKNRISKKKVASAQDDRFAKAELDAEESQRPDRRPRELPGELPRDLAHELRGDNRGNSVAELPGDMAHELRGGFTDRNDVRYMPAGERDGNDIGGWGGVG